MAGRDDFDLVRLDKVPVRRLRDPHTGPASDNLGQHALAISRQVQDDDEAHAAVGRHALEELPERLYAPGRRADRHDLHGSALGRVGWVAGPFP